MREKYGDDVQTWPWLDDELYISAFGPPKKGRYQGFGNKVGLSGCAGGTQTYVSRSASQPHGSSTHEIGEIRCTLDGMRTELDSLSTMRAELDSVQTRLSTLGLHLLDELIVQLRETDRPIDASQRLIIIEALERMRVGRSS